MNIGDRVRIVKCETCPKIVGKVYKVKLVNHNVVELDYGRGRPIDGRPAIYNINDLEPFSDIVCI